MLNGDCGSDFIQKDKALPTQFGGVPPGARCCAVDGDSDRLLYFSPRADGSLELLDGDKIATLAAMLLRQLIGELPEGARDVSVGIVQTAYANGAASKYIRENLGCAVAVTPTGVKFLHEAAHHFDVGVYFEANGHGTVLFAKPFLARLQQVRGLASRGRVACARVCGGGGVSRRRFTHSRACPRCAGTAGAREPRSVRPAGAE